MKRVHTSNEQGLTILEVMIALALLATISALTWGTMSSSFKLRNAATTRFETLQSMRRAVDRITTELSMAFVVDEDFEELAANREITYRTVFEGDNDELTFTTMSHLQYYDDMPSSGQAEITYRVQSQRGRDGRMHRNLVRREDAPIDDRPDRGGRLYTVLRDVEDLEFEYWDGDREIAGDAWTRSWDAYGDHEGVLPDRVRVRVEVKNPFGNRDNFTIVGQARIQLRDPLFILPADMAEALDSIADAQEDQLQNQAESLVDEVQRQLGSGDNAERNR